MKVVEDLHDFDYSVFIIGTAIFVLLPVIAIKTGIEILTAFAAIGPFFIGYKSKNYRGAFSVAGLSGIFLWIAIIYGALGQVVDINLNPYLLNTLLLIVLIFVGGFIGSIGHLFKVNRTSAIEMANKNKKGTKNVKNQVKPIEQGYKKVLKKIKK